ncbi:MAG: CcmD family protein [Chloroflexi bacterium]|nr:CcmD family protein [Chloroflexota bacterium]
MIFLFAAYFVLWALIFGYVYSIALRQKRLEREIDALRTSIEARKAQDKG